MFFEKEEIRYVKIQESLEFYRDQLREEYRSLAKRVDLTFRLWIACVVTGFLVLLSGLILVFIGAVAQAV